MNKIEKFIQEYNLISTKTILSEEYDDFYLDEEVDRTNSISLYSVVEEFYNMYSNYSNLDYGEKIKFLDTYEVFKDGLLYEDDMIELRSRIAGELYNSLLSMDITLSSKVDDEKNNIDIVFRLDKRFNIMYAYDVMIRNHKSRLTIAEVNNIARKIYINKEYLPSLYQDELDEEKILIKKTAK